MNPRKLIAEDMGNEARRKRIERYRQKLAPEASVESLADMDEAIDKAALPTMVSPVISEGISETVADADEWNKANAKALAELEEDEEDAKWMAKQKG